MKLNGWKRIGIGASVVVWAIGGVLYGVQKAKDEWQWIGVEHTQTSIEANGRTRKGNNECLKEGEKIVVDALPGIWEKATL